MRRYIIVILLLLSVNTTTDLSLNNCPDEFNITQANSTSGIGTGQLVVFFFSSFMNDETVKKVEDIIIQEDQQEYNKLVEETYSIPFLILAIAFGITFFIILLCVVFEKSCPPCHSWRRDFTKRPYQKFEVRCVAFFAVLFSIAILATSIASFTIMPQLLNEIQTTKCALYGALDVALNGDDQQWGGFSHIKNQVGNISKLLPSANTEVNTYFTDDETIKGGMDSMKEQNLALYQTYKNSQVDTPDPNADAASQKTDSNFINTLLGPSTTDNMMTSQINKALIKTQQLSDQVNKILNSAFLIVESSSTIQSNTNASQEILSMFQSQLNNYKAKLDIFSNDFFDPFFNWGIYVAQVVIGFVLVASIAIIIGSVSIHILDIYDCRHFLHFGWVIYGISYFGVILIAFFMLPVGSLGYTFCQFYNGMLTNETQFKRIGEYNSQHILNRLDVCLYGDGNVLSKFQINQQMNTVSQLFVNIDLFNQYDDATNEKYINQTLSQSQITQWIETATSYRQGITKDNDPLLTTDANCLLALQEMNKYTLWNTTNSGEAIQRCTRDRWVYDAVDCAGSEHVYNETVDNSLDISMSLVTCFSLNTKFDTTKTSEWTVREITKRYRQVKQECSQAYDIIISYAESITKYRDSRIQLFQSIIDSLTALQSSHNNFDTSMTSFRTNLASFQSTRTISDLNNFVTNQIDGLLVSSVCNPISDRMKFLYNTFCVNAIGNTVQLGICVMLLLCFMIGGIFTACIFAQRSATIKRLFTVHEKNFALADASVHSETFQRKKEDSSSSSSSSSEDD